jgi:Flp pilus assembly protein TadD/2-polyprenyl-3-methyl-5-hydroxy-6-metoxy-1,4-benzoquinol methylase
MGKPGVTELQSWLGEAVRLHQSGLMEQAALLYRKVLASDPRNPDALHLLGMIALQQGQPRSAVELISQALANRDNDASYHFHLALAFQSLNDMARAVEGYRRALALKPDDPDIHNNLGNALAAQGKLEEARQALQRALVLQPGNAVAHSNLGNVQRSLGLHGEAEISFRKAIGLQPGFAGALVNLGNLQYDKGELQAAEASYRRALSLAPREVAAHCGLGVTLWQLGRHDDALGCYRRALALDPNHAESLANLADAGGGDDALELVRRSLASRETPQARKLFVRLARHWNGETVSGDIRPLMVRALTEAWDRPAALAAAAARMVRANPAIAPMVARANAAWPRLLSLAALLDGAGFAPLAQDSLLTALLTSTPNTDIPLERLLTQLRGAMVRELAQTPAIDPQAERVAAALAQQCFINEYVFLPGAAELAAAQTLLEQSPLTPLQLLLLASYVPLHRRNQAQELLARSWPPALEAVLTQQLREPMAEHRLRGEVMRLTAIEDPVSRLVQSQYEENPYPRWVRAAPETPDRIENFLSGKFARTFARPSTAMQDILVAGCGTGQRAIAMARKFPDAHVSAVDLSLASLAYARRKTDEAGLKIDYGQGDILLLEGRRFDLIESLGVLHHLADPFAGWRSLLSLLRPGGVMLLGLYSARARQPIARARARIAELALGSGAEDIRGFRQALMASDRPEASILDSEDFFSLSACRDLLFHVQEHHLSLPQIARFIAENDLRLLGFELEDAVLGAYRRRFPQDDSATDLACWDTFEAEHPGLFGGMYVFWIQTPGAGTREALNSGPALLQSEAKPGPRR